MIKEVREVTDKEFELPTEGNNVADQPAENVTSNESLESSAAAIADSFKQDEKTVVEPTAEAIAETIADINSDAAVAVTAMPTKAPKKEKKKKDEYRVSNFDIIKNYHRYTAKEKKHYRYLFWHRIAAYVWPFFRAVIIFGLSFVILYPILYMISTSIRPQAEMNDPSVMWIPKTIRMENFVEVWNAIDYPGTLWNTLILNIVSSVLQVGTCALTGYGFARFKFKGKNFLIRGSKDIEERFIGNAFMFNEKERAKILKNPTGKYNHKELTKPFYDKVKDKDDVTKMQYIDINFWLIGDILLKADKMSMAHSLEVRVPFLDKEVFNVARTLPTKYKVNKSNTKYAMRKAANQYLPDMVAEKKKLGFPVPIRIWLKDEKYYNMIKKAFTSEAAEKYFNTDEIVKYLDDHKEGKADNSRKIWTIYMFLVWYEDFFGKGVYEAA